MKRLKNYKQRRGFIAVTFVIALLGAGIGLFTLWSFSLFSQLEYVTSQRALKQPPQFYSDIFDLKPGMRLPPTELERRLIDRGYSEQAAGINSDRWFRNDNGTIEVCFRQFDYPDGESVGGLYRFTFSGETLQEIVKFPEGTVQTHLYLEPKLLSEFSADGVANRPWVELEKVPPFLRRAVIATEDRRFYHHPGVDPRSLVRAVWINVSKKGLYQGGSTLTQQLVKNAFLTQKRTMKRKATEVLLAFLMELRYSKNAILEMYLNQIYLGQSGSHTIYGMEDAARSYFGKPAAELTLGESALLAGIIRSPASCNPRSSLEKAVQRRNVVLELMYHERFITAQEYRRARAEKPVLAPPVGQGNGDYYLTFVRELLEKELGGSVLDFQGYRIFTAIDPDLQKAAERTLAAQKLDGALVAVDPRTGFVRALVGGRNFVSAPFNRALYARRQPGSAFKPFVYAAALESKAATLATVLEDKPLTLTSGGKAWTPKNYDGTFAGTTTVRDALVYSRNIPSVELLQRTGIGNVIALAHNMGITSQLEEIPSLALGSDVVSPLELTLAYAPFANGGSAVTPVFVRWVTDADGNVVEEHVPALRRALSPETAALITDVLQDVIERGTGKAVRALGFAGPAAGKTGTSDDCIDAWFVGYTPELLCGVWLGHDTPQPLGRTAGAIAVPAWVSFMKEALPYNSDAKFAAVQSLVTATIDPETGMLARSGCPTRKDELFIPGTEPAKECELHVGGVKGFFKRIFGIFKKKD